MNRIILIGNGFDLAHGLKTSYADFIDWYWGEWGAKLLQDDVFSNSDGLCLFELHFNVEQSWHYVYRNYTNARLVSFLDKFDGKKFVGLIKKDRQTCSFSFLSPLMEELCMQLKERKWVDIENVFFKHLNNDLEDPEKVNKELAVIRGRLIDYLNEVQKEASGVEMKDDYRNKMQAPFSKKDFAIGSMNHWVEMLQQRVGFPRGHWDVLISSYLQGDKLYCSRQDVFNFLSDYSNGIIGGIEYLDDRIPSGFLFPDRILILNFNYTNTADSYLPNVDRFSVNHIHGELSKPESVVFGYGDEIDENYKKLSNRNDNRYLENIKSIKYLESPNYRNLLDFIESEPFQVFIMGHSCGNSDRTLLNTIFEHRNCVSIKPFYHVFDDGHDNYMELAQNISRNFTDMKLMRDRVVNKTFCETY